MKALDRRVVTLLRVALGVLFIVAAWPKLVDPRGFSDAINHYRLLPVPLERVAALVLPALELVVGISLIVGILDAGASALALLMLVVFTAAVGVALARGLDITCGCFETDGKGPKVGLQKILENVAMLAVSVGVAWGDRSWLSIADWFRRSGDIE
ncbi:MAG: MauE/DoxX family redox-associated membrane protein [bacterium]